MIKKILVSFLPLSILVILSSSHMSDNGKAGRTGSPGESTCITCHNSFALNSGGGSITLQSPEMPGLQYIPGQTYAMSITVSRTGNSLFGVDIEALTSSNDNAGVLTITNSASTLIKNITVNGVVRHNITHTLNGGASSPNSKVFDFSWTAPTAGTGNVTFYFTGAACNGTGGTNADYIYSGTQMFSESSGCTSAPEQPGIISGDSITCNGTSLLYSVEPVTEATSYNWTLPPGWTGISTTNSINLIAGNTPGNITVSANNSCGNSTLSSFPVSLGSVEATISNNNDTLFASIGASYEWYLNGNFITGAINSYYLPVENGNYIVVVYDYNGCSGSSDVYNFLSLGVNGQDYDLIQFTIYPNPVSDILVVNIEDKFRNSSLTVYNISGQVVEKKILSNKVNEIDLSGLAEGVYHVSIGNVKNQNSKRFLISR